MQHIHCNWTAGINCPHHMLIVATVSVVSAASIHAAALYSRPHYAERWLDAILECDAIFDKMRDGECNGAVHRACEYGDMTEFLLLNKSYAWQDIHREGHAMKTSDGYFVGPECLDQKPNLLFTD